VPELESILRGQMGKIFLQQYRPIKDFLTREPRVNLDRLVSQIVLDCSLLRWFAFNGRRDEVMAAIALQRVRAHHTEGQVLDFLVRHGGGQQ